MLDHTSPDAYTVGKPKNNITRMASGKWRVRMRTASVHTQMFSQATVADLPTALAKQAEWQFQINAGTMPAELLIPDNTPATGPFARVDLTPVRHSMRAIEAIPPAANDNGVRSRAQRNTASYISNVGVLTFHHAANEYEHDSARAASDISAINYVCRLVGDTPIKEMATLAWVKKYVTLLQSDEHHLTPGSIRKRIEAAARVIDHHIASRVNSDTQPVVEVNPLRTLPNGYSDYPRSHPEPKFDEERNRRLSDEEVARIDAVFAGHKPADRERALFPKDGKTREIEILWRLLSCAGLRLREAYSLRVGDLNKQLPWVRVKQSKDAKNIKPPRPVPLYPDLYAQMLALCKGRDDRELLFSFWDGVQDKQEVTAQISNRMRVIFEHAKVDDLTVHDLRHEAACRTVLMRNPDEQFTFQDSVIIKMFGWTKPDMLQRYLSLRGDDVAHMMLRAFPQKLAA